MLTILQIINGIFLVSYLCLRCLPILSGNFVWTDGINFEFKPWIMQVHVILCLLLHVLALSYAEIDSEVDLWITILWVSVISVNVLLMNIASFFEPYSRKLSGWIHWSVNIMLSIVSLMGIWNPICLMILMWILDCGSLLLIFNSHDN
jgi:hypothetical protein